MAFDGVIAFQGKDHITASQLGRLIAGTAGTGRYVLRTQNELAASMPNANTVRIATGDLVMDGRYVTNESNVDLAVQSGVSGYKRNDLVVLKYSKNAGTGVETFAPAVLKGTQTTGEPSDPTYSAGDIMGGSTAAVMPLYRIPIDGIRPGTPVKLFDTFSSTEDIRDSVSQAKTLWHGAWFGSNGEAKLSEPLSAQKNGMVLVWSAYEDGEAKDWSWVYTYVPRWHAVADTGTGGIVCSASRRREKRPRTSSSRQCGLKIWRI